MTPAEPRAVSNSAEGPSAVDASGLPASFLGMGPPDRTRPRAPAEKPAAGSVAAAGAGGHPARGHAVVLGAGFAGLLAARVLAEHFDRVTLVERDDLRTDDLRTDGPRRDDPPIGDPRRGGPWAEPRRGVAQGAHLHALAEGGRACLEELFPGFTAELTSRGAPRAQVLVDTRWYVRGLRLGPASTGLTSLLASRPLLERVVRERVLAHPGVRLRQRTRAVGLVGHPADGGPGRVTGARLATAGGDPETIDADLVVDATGRGSRADDWLAELALPRPPRERVDVDLGYVSRLYRRRPDDLDGQRGVIISTVPGRRGGGAIAQEADRWIVTLAGMLGDHPPTDPAGFERFAASLPVPDIHQLVTRAEAIGEPVPYRFRGSSRRSYERMRRPCAGFVAIGDALCSLNPLYAQGMTVAAQQALALRDALTATAPPGGGDADLPGRFFAAAAKPTDVAWGIATGSDLAYRQVQGRRTPRIRLAGAYLPFVHAAAHADPVVARAFMRVVNLVDPPATLLRPDLLVRVLRSGRPGPPDRPDLHDRHDRPDLNSR